jgi:hypothetical protein
LDDVRIDRVVKIRPPGARGTGQKKVKNECRVQSAKCRVQRENRKRSDAEKRHGQMTNDK